MGTPLCVSIHIPSYYKVWYDIFLYVETTNLVLSWWFQAASARLGSSCMLHVQNLLVQAARKVVHHAHGATPENNRKQHSDSSGFQCQTKSKFFEPMFCVSLPYFDCFAENLATKLDAKKQKLLAMFTSPTDITNKRGPPESDGRMVDQSLLQTAGTIPLAPSSFSSKNGPKSMMETPIKPLTDLWAISRSNNAANVGGSSHGSLGPVFLGLVHPLKEMLDKPIRLETDSITRITTTVG